MNLQQNFHLAFNSYRIFIPWASRVPLQMFTTRHSNRKFTIVMALSTTFKQCAPESTKFGKITQNKGHYAVQVIQGHRFWYQSKAHIRLPISDLY